MFGSKDRPPQAVDATTTTITRSHITEGLSIKGNIEGDIDLLLDGRLEGNLRCRSVTIGKTGEIIGKIIAQETIVDGRIEGDLEAKTVRLNVTAVVVGDVRHEVIEVAAGARIEGRYSRLSEKTAEKLLVQPARKPDLSDAPPKTPSASAASAEKETGKKSVEPPAAVNDTAAKDTKAHAKAN